MPHVIIHLFYNCNFHSIFFLKGFLWDMWWLTASQGTDTLIYTYTIPLRVGKKKKKLCYLSSKGIGELIPCLNQYKQTNG